MKKAPNAAYALVQTALVQDEALKRANVRIQELQAQLGAAGQSQRQQSGFLDNVRNALLGSDEPHTRVSPTARSGSAGTPGAEPQPGYSAPGTAPAIAGQRYSPAGPTFGSGGSFLSTAAAAAAGVIGGGLLRSTFSNRSGFAGSDRVASGAIVRTPHSVKAMIWRAKGALTMPIKTLSTKTSKTRMTLRMTETTMPTLTTISMMSDAEFGDRFEW